LASAVAWPSGPVQALAQPLLITTTRERPPDALSLAFETSTGAATALLVVNTAALDAGTSLTINARSRLPDFLIPQATPAARKPAGAETPPSIGSIATAGTVMPKSGRA